MRLVPASVVTLKSMLSFPGTSMPRLPRAYSPSVFSRKNIQSMPSWGISTGRTLAKRSSSRRSVTLALSRVPPLGVVVGPFKSTSHFFTSASTSGGTAQPWARRFSMVRPWMSLSSMRPEESSSARSFSSTRRAWAIMMGPMPSPPATPMTILSILEKSLAGAAFSMRSCLSSCWASSSLKCSAAFSMYSVLSIIYSPLWCNSAALRP